MMYNMGKVLVFLTLPLTPGRAIAGAGGDGGAAAAGDLRGAVVSLLRSRRFMPALLAMLGPVLDAGVAEKSEQELNAVDLVLTVLKQVRASAWPAALPRDMLWSAAAAPRRALCSPTRAARFPRTLPNSSPKCPTAPRATCRA